MKSKIINFFKNNIKLLSFLSITIILTLILLNIEELKLILYLNELYKSITEHIFMFMFFMIIFLVLYINKFKIIKELELNNFIETKNKELNDLNVIFDKNIISSITDINGKIVEVTQSFLDTYKFSLEEIIGKSHNILKSFKISNEVYKELWSTISKGKDWEGELLNISKDGEEIWISIKISPIFDKNGEIIKYRSISNNITDQKKALYLAKYDQLTELPNKVTFDNELSKALKRLGEDKKLAIIFIDIDNFKDINEKYGYLGGDKVLKIITKRLKEVINKKDILARYSGDEFILLVENITKYKLSKYINNINDNLHKNIFMYDDDKDRLNLTISIGISISNDNSNNVQDLIKSADTAKLYVKQHGKSNFKIFNEEINSFYKKKLLIEDTLTEYIKNKDFYLLYQPKYDLKSKEIIGGEALIRMKDNVFYPNEFISIAEETDKITDITKIVIEKIIEDLKELDLSSKPNFNISINLSSKDLNDSSILNFLLEECEKNNVDPSLISIEITEYTLMNNVDKTIKILQDFRDKNIEISIDDFGTGYSSMNYLKLLPINVIKIDKSFIDNIDSNIKDKHIVEAMINLSKALKLNIVVEGIETSSQEDLLNKIGCQSGQGYLFSKPISFEKFKNKIFNKE